MLMENTKPTKSLLDKLYTRQSKLSIEQFKNLIIEYISVFPWLIPAGEVIKEAEESIRKLKIEINNKYSFLKRLSIPSEQTKLYKAYCRRMAKQKSITKRQKKMYSTYKRYLQKMIKSSSKEDRELLKNMFNRIEPPIFYTPYKIVCKEDFINVLKVRYESTIDTLKAVLKANEEELRKTKELCDKLNKEIHI